MADTVVRTFRRSFKYRLYPTKAQELVFTEWLDRCRELHNAAIEERREAWKCGISIWHAAQRRQLPEIKKFRPEYAELNSQVLQEALHRVDFAFRQFFRRIKLGQAPGYPRFKSRDRYDSLTWPQDQGFHLIGTKHLWLSKIGKIRIKLHRAIQGKPKTVTLKREAGHWYAAFSCDKVPAHAYPPATSEVGIDMGLESFATLSTGEKIDNPRWYREAEARLKGAQQELSRKKRRSKRRQKAKRRVANLYAKTANQRKDFQHKLAHRIVSENSLISVEDLTPVEMVSDTSRGMAKSIHDASWGRFLSTLGAKAEEAGRRFVKVPPRGTSSTCFQCGKYRKKALSERLHSCECGLVLDRDVHASHNILRLGRSLQVSTS
jgi:putative transposase